MISLRISGSKEPYIISIANNLNDYDSVDFLKGPALDAITEYEITLFLT